MEFAPRRDCGSHHSVKCENICCPARKTQLIHEGGLQRCRLTATHKSRQARCLKARSAENCRLCSRSDKGSCLQGWQHARDTHTQTRTALMKARPAHKRTRHLRDRTWCCSPWSAMLRTALEPCERPGCAVIGRVKIAVRSLTMCLYNAELGSECETSAV